MSSPVKSHLNKTVFVCASSIIIALLLYTAALPKQAQSVFTLIQASIIENGSWFYVLTVAFIFFFVIFYLFHKTILIAKQVHISFFIFPASERFFTLHNVKNDVFRYKLA